MRLVRWNDDGLACATCINLVTILFFDTRYLHAASVCEYFRVPRTASVTKRGRIIKEGRTITRRKEGRNYYYYLIAYTHILMHYIGRICSVLLKKVFFIRSTNYMIRELCMGGRTDVEKYNNNANWVGCVLQAHEHAH